MNGRTAGPARRQGALETWTQPHLFPPSPRDWLPGDHLAYFISDTVDELDISAIEVAYRRAGAGTLSYHPRMMLKLLIYSYCTGMFSSRAIARGVEENVALRVLAAGHSPSHRTLCRFRTDHIATFEGLFVQVVQITNAMTAIMNRNPKT